VLEVCRSRAAIIYDDGPDAKAGPSGRGRSPNDMSLRSDTHLNKSLIPMHSNVCAPLILLPNFNSGSLVALQNSPWQLHLQSTVGLAAACHLRSFSQKEPSRCGRGWNAHMCFELCIWVAPTVDVAEMWT